MSKGISYNDRIKNKSLKDFTRGGISYSEGGVHSVCDVCGCELNPLGECGCPYVDEEDS